MLTDDFNPKAALAATSCSRCHTLGLVEIDADAYDTAPLEHRHQVKAYINPSVYARGTSCSQVMEWPDCCK